MASSTIIGVICQFVVEFFLIILGTSLENPSKPPILSLISRNPCNPLSLNGQTPLAIN